MSDSLEFTRMVARSHPDLPGILLSGDLVPLKRRTPNPNYDAAVQFQFKPCAMNMSSVRLSGLVIFLWRVNRKS